MTTKPVFSALALHEYDPDLLHQVEWFDACVKLSDKQLANFTRYLLRFHGQITSSFLLPGGSRVGDIEAHMRICLPKGLKTRFIDESGVTITPALPVTGQ